MFRRRKIAQNGIDLFNQEYPAHPSHAFLNTGRPVFNPEQLTKCLDDAKDVKERLALEADEFVHQQTRRTFNLLTTQRRRAVCHWGRRCYGRPKWRLLGRASPRQQEKTSRDLAWSSPSRLFCRSALRTRRILQ